MKCACCGRSLKPNNAVRHIERKFDSIGKMTNSYTVIYGPVCAARLGFAKLSSAPKVGSRTAARRKLSNTIQKKIVVQNGQEELFGEVA